MRISRIFTEQGLAPDREIALDEVTRRYLVQVLRLRVGQTLILFDGSGADFEARLTLCDKRSCIVRIIRELSVEPPPRLNLHLGIGISRGERMDLAIQKSVELGVTAITPLFTARAVVQLKADRLRKRVAHWQGVVRGACEQSGRSRLAHLNPPTDLAGWLGANSPGLMLYHKAEESLADCPAPGNGINLLIGPEGGLSGSERALAAASGYTAVRLGPRVLRTETAPIAALAAIQVLWGDVR